MFFLHLNASSTPRDNTISVTKMCVEWLEKLFAFYESRACSLVHSNRSPVKFSLSLHLIAKNLLVREILKQTYFQCSMVKRLAQLRKPSTGKYHN